MLKAYSPNRFAPLTFTIFMRFLPLLCIFLFLGGCAATTPEYKKVAQIHVGMSKSEVLACFGTPVKTVKNGCLEVLSYKLTDTKPTLFGPPPPKTGHYIVISNGRVESFGRE